jgi:tetratricopeptide (TPR) repeat protein
VAKDRKSRLDQAAKLVEKDQLDKAIRIYTKLIGEDPSDFRTVHKAAEIYARNGDAEAALKGYLKVAEHHARQGFYPQAAAVYKQALRIASNRSDVHLTLGELHLKMELKAEAVSDFAAAASLFQKDNAHRRAVSVLERALEAAPDQVVVHLRLADALEQAGDPRRASERFERAAHLLREQKRLTEFLRVGDRALKLDPTRYDLARAIAATYIEHRKPKRALSRLQKAFRADPGHVDTLDLMARAFIALDQPKKAVRVYDEKAQRQSKLGDRAGAEATYAKVLELRPGDPAAISFLGLGPELSGESPVSKDSPAPISPVPSGATGMFHTADETQVGRLVAEAASFSKLGLVARARDYLIRAVSARSADIALREQLMEAYVSLQDNAGAVRQLIALIDEASAQGQVEQEARYRNRLAQLGQSATTQTGTEAKGEGEGLESLLAASAAEFEEDDLNFSLTVDPVISILADVDAANGRGDMTQALAMLDDAIDLFPENPKLTERRDTLIVRQRRLRTSERVGPLPPGVPATYDTIRTMINGGEAVNAIEALRPLVERQVPGQSCSHYLTGVALLELNKGPRGISFLKRALHGDDLQVDLRDLVLYELGRAYSDSGDSEEGIYYLKKVVRRRPGLADAKDRLRQLLSERNAP